VTFVTDERVLSVAHQDQTGVLRQIREGLESRGRR